MSVSSPADDLVNSGYFDLNLTGLDTLTFTDISGLTHQVTVTGGLKSGKDGKPVDSRAVGTPEALTLTMKNVLAKDMALWTWLDQSITTGTADASKKQGTLMIKSVADGSVQMTWNLTDVYLKSVSVDTMGSGSAEFLMATIELVVRECKPM